LLVDQKRRVEYDAEFKAKAHLKREECRQFLADYKFNPASVLQLRGLLFDKWKLPVIRETDTGDPSTDDETIRSLLIDRSVDEKKKKFLSAVRWFRKFAKLRGYFRQLAPYTVSVGLDDLCLSPENDVEQKPASMSLDEWKYRQKEMEKEEARNRAKVGCVREDGRIHACWNSHGTVTRRFSSSDPNMQNIPRSIRDMFIPQPGCKYVYADMDQLELRIITNLSGAKQYVKAFADGFDPHTITVISIYGDEGKKAYEEAVKLYGKNYKDDHKDFSRMRDFGLLASRRCAANIGAAPGARRLG
jgi:DNA polymerase I-like protein with 3'-5' exonuclease and polymerase domains